jgi:A/G-specific adenine glycosylase
VRRPATGLLAGLWEFPSIVVDANSDEVARQVAVDAYLARLGVHVGKTSGE